MRNIVVLIGFLGLAACKTHTGVQGEYIVMRDSCQGFAESNIGQYADGTGDVRDRNAKLVTLFSDCMFESGWTVAAPKREGEQDTASIIADPQHPQNQSSAMVARPSIVSRSYPSENQAVLQGQTMQSVQPAAQAAGGAANEGTVGGSYYAYPQEFKADPGVGVGASVKPGRDFTTHE